MTSHIATSNYRQYQDISKKNRPRIILLLDLDCFYAQCETVRLNLPQNLPLCLLQWNSALAVNYPAREYGIKRGDGFEEIQKKGRGKVIALHLPVLPLQETQRNKTDPDDENDAHFEEEPSSLEALYNQQFRLSPQQQTKLYENEKNVMRKPEEGKASLDRYRLASNRIFTVILESLQELTADKTREAINKKANGKTFILEKASIDELFVDVTDYCYQSISNDNDVDRIQRLKSVKHATNVVHPHSKYSSSFDSWEQNFDNFDLMADDEEKEHESALWQGCYVAKCVRDDVFRKLGFTLSAGISMNKLMAKLGAGYGKPNGQAVIFQTSILKVMEETKIRKVRNLGGKLGKLVQKILPPKSEKVSCINHNLSLSQLTDHLESHETATFVFNASRGICYEPVKATHKVLNKSITSFKSFPKVNSLTELKPYVQLLTKDLVKRVSFDYKWNDRWPKSCSVQYTYVDIKSLKENSDKKNEEINLKSNKPTKSISKSVRDHRHANELCSKSIRMSFPSLDLYTKSKNGSFEQILLSQLVSMMENKLSHRYPMCRIGLSAIDFETYCAKQGIDSFFKVKSNENRKNYAYNNDMNSHLEFEANVSKHTPANGNFIETNNISRSRDAQISSLRLYSRPTTFKVETNTMIDQQMTTTNLDTEETRNNDEFIASKLASPHKISHLGHIEQVSPDFLYAQKLQASFDKESKVLRAFEKNAKKRKEDKVNCINRYFPKQTNKQQKYPTKKMKNLDNFFPKRFG